MRMFGYVTASLKELAEEERKRYNAVYCGICRQMLYEYCPDIKVIVNDENGELIKVKARDLLPFAWEPVVC